MKQTERANFGSKLGIILATAGSAVGLGNVWRFPYMTGQNGGATFIVIYALCVLMIGIPCMVSEFIVGRHGASNTARAYGRMGAAKGWMAIGFLAVFTSFLISGYYSIVSGWCLNYTVASLTGDLRGTPDSFVQYFKDFSTNPVTPIIWGIIFLGGTHWIITRGVRRGIEKASKLLMPLLFILLLVIVVAACLLPDADKGLTFLFKPDFDHINKDVFLNAIGQSFYSLSIAMGCVCTYASYFTRQTNLAGSAVQISVIDSVVAILAGMMIFPAAFSVGVSPDSGPSLIFITLPNVFQQAFASMPLVGYVISILFYALLAVAALTSTISMHEIGTAYFHEELNRPRTQAAWIVTIGACVIGVLSSLSCGAYDLQLLGMSLMDFFDCITAQYMMPIGALLTSLYIGWGARTAVVNREFTNCGTVYRRLFPVYLFMVRFICPILIAIVFLNQLGVI